MHNVFVTHPYYVGNKNSKSLCVIIPSKLAKSLELSPNSFLVISKDQNNIILSHLDLVERKRS